MPLIKALKTTALLAAMLSADVATNYTMIANPEEKLYTNKKYLFGTVDYYGRDIADRVKQDWLKIQNKCGIKDDELALIVLGDIQKIFLVHNSDKFHFEKYYDVSTGRKGFNECDNRRTRTPSGFFKIVDKIGDGMPIGSVFKGREYKGKSFDQYKKGTIVLDDTLTTRLIVLDGVDNCNQERINIGFYIHGTPMEQFIGMPASHGCVRMRNKEVIELFDIVEKGMYVYVDPGHFK